MTKSKFLFDKVTKVIEQGIISYKDLSSEILNVLKTKRDEIVFKMQLTTKEEVEILEKRICQNELKGCNTFTTAIFLNQNTMTIQILWTQKTIRKCQRNLITTIPQHIRVIEIKGSV